MFGVVGHGGVGEVEAFEELDGCALLGFMLVSIIVSCSLRGRKAGILYTYGDVDG